MIEPSGSKRWAFLFWQNGRLREMGLGGVNAVPLIKARELAAAARALLVAGGDPIQKRKQAGAGIQTFGQFADRFIEAKEAGWKYGRHRAMEAGLDAIYSADPIEARRRRHD